MHNGKYVFSQLLDFIDKEVFLRIANKHSGNRYVKQFTCYNQFAVLMFGQLSNRESLRDVVITTQSHSMKAFRFGFWLETCFNEKSTFFKLRASQKLSISVK